jgi:hypothetical protein
MIKNIKIHNILDIIEISKYMKPKKCINPRKSKCDIPSDITQGSACPFVFPFNLVKHNKYVLCLFAKPLMKLFVITPN